MLLMFMSADCAKRSINASSSRYCTPSAAPVIACVPRRRARGTLMTAERLNTSLLRAWATPQIFRSAMRLSRTHAFRLAALYFLVFAASVLGLLLFVYWTTANFVERQTEATLDAEIVGLAEQYAQRGLSGLIQIVAARSAGDRGDAMIYLVTDPEGKPLVGNISAWPAGVPTRTGWLSFGLERKIN